VDDVNVDHSPTTTSTGTAAAAAASLHVSTKKVVDIDSANIGRDGRRLCLYVRNPPSASVYSSSSPVAAAAAEWIQQC